MALLYPVRVNQIGPVRVPKGFGRGICAGNLYSAPTFQATAEVGARPPIALGPGVEMVGEACPNCYQMRTRPL